MNQLKVGGRIVIPIGEDNQTMFRFTRIEKSKYKRRIWAIQICANGKRKMNIIYFWTFQGLFSIPYPSGFVVYHTFFPFAKAIFILANPESLINNFKGIIVKPTSVIFF